MASEATEHPTNMELHDAIQLRRGTGEVGCVGLPAPALSFCIPLTEASEQKAFNRRPV